MYDFFAPLLNFFRQQVGLKADIGSPNGNLNAKLNCLLGDITGLYNRCGPTTTDLTVASSQSLADGIYRYRNLTVNAGQVLSPATNGLVLVCDLLTINGTISASGKGTAGGAAISRTSNTTTGGWPGNPGADKTGAYAGTGGGGGCTDLNSGSGSRSADGGKGGDNLKSGGAGGHELPTGPQYGTAGSAGSPVWVYDWDQFNIGSLLATGGGSGALTQDTTTSATAASGSGGNGGGCLIIVAKEIVIGVNGAIRADGINGGNASYTTGAIIGGGGGGGGGGYVLISAGKLTNNGSNNISANAGTYGASAGTCSGFSAYHGSAGGAGVVETRVWS